MSNITDKIDALDWQKIAEEMHDKGYAIIPEFPSFHQCQSLFAQYDTPELFRKQL